jgi:hypothetical protein
LYFSDLLSRFLKIVRTCLSFFLILSVTHNQHALKRCDREKPNCGPRGTQLRDDECDYMNGPERSRTALLEDTASQREARLLGLEDHSALDIILNAAHQHGGQVYWHSIYSVLMIAMMVAPLSQIHGACCS